MIVALQFLYIPFINIVKGIKGKKKKKKIREKPRNNTLCPSGPQRAL